MEAMSRQGKGNDLGVDLTSTQVGRKLETAEIIGQEIGESKNQVRRYVRLTNLLPEFLREKGVMIEHSDESKKELKSVFPY